MNFFRENLEPRRYAPFLEQEDRPQAGGYSQKISTVLAREVSSRKHARELTQTRRLHIGGWAPKHLLQGPSSRLSGIRNDKQISENEDCIPDADESFTRARSQLPAECSVTGGATGVSGSLEPWMPIPGLFNPIQRTPTRLFGPGGS